MPGMFTLLYEETWTPVPSIFIIHSLILVDCSYMYFNISQRILKERTLGEIEGLAGGGGGGDERDRDTQERIEEGRGCEEGENMKIER